MPEFDEKSDDDSDESGNFTLRVESTNVSKHSVSGVGTAHTSVSGSKRPSSNLSPSKQIKNRKTSPQVMDEICMGYSSMEHFVDIQPTLEDANSNYSVIDTKIEKACPISDKNAIEQGRSKTFYEKNQKQAELAPAVADLTKQQKTDSESKELAETCSLLKYNTVNVRESGQTQSVVQQTEITINEDFEYRPSQNMPNTVSAGLSESKCEGHAKSNNVEKHVNSDTEISPPMIEIDKQLKLSNISPSEATFIINNPLSQQGLPEQPLNQVPSLSLEYNLKDKAVHPSPSEAKSNLDSGHTFVNNFLNPKNSLESEHQRTSVLDSKSKLTHGQACFSDSHYKSNDLPSLMISETPHASKMTVFVDSELLSTHESPLSAQGFKSGELSGSDANDFNLQIKPEKNPTIPQESQAVLPRKTMSTSGKNSKAWVILPKESDRSSQFMSDVSDCKIKLEMESNYQNDLKPSATVDKNICSIIGQGKGILPNPNTLPRKVSKYADDQEYKLEQLQPQYAIELDTDVERKLGISCESPSVKQISCLFETNCDKDKHSPAQSKPKKKHRKSSTHNLQKQDNISLILSQTTYENMDDFKHTKPLASSKSSGDNKDHNVDPVTEIKNVRDLLCNFSSEKSIKALINNSKKTDILPSETITDIRKESMSTTVGEVVTDNLTEGQLNFYHVSNDNSNKMKLEKRSKERKKTSDKAGHKEKGKSSVTTPRGQKVSLGTLAKGSVDLHYAGKEKSRSDHANSDRSDIDLDKNDVKPNKINPFDMYINDKVVLPHISTKHTDTKSQSESRHGRLTQEHVTPKKTMAPKKQMIPLPVIPIGGQSQEPDTDDMHKAPGGQMVVSARNQVSTHSSCKTPVMEKVSTTVFV